MNHDNTFLNICHQISESYLVLNERLYYTGSWIKLLEKVFEYDTEYAILDFLLWAFKNNNFMIWAGNHDRIIYYI
jgi:hypothetical protein